MSDGEIRVQIEAGEGHLRREEWAEAERAFRQAIAQHPTAAVGWSKLGVTLARQRRFGEAIEALRHAVDLEPRYAPGYSNLGNVYREQGRTEDALRAYQRAVEADPDYWIAHQNLGALYRKMGRFGDAVVEYRKATRLSAGRARAERRGCLPSAAGVLAGLVLLLGLRVLLRGLP